MKRLILYLAVTLSGACWIAAAYFSCFYYHLYRTNCTELEYRCSVLEGQVNQLQSRMYVVPNHAWAEISTTDQPVSRPLDSNEGGGNEYWLHTAGRGNWIGPEFRIPAGSTNRLEFDIHYKAGTNNAVVGAWLSHAEPYQGLAMLDEFELYQPHDTNVIRLVVQPRAGASFKFKFTVVILNEH